MRDDIKNKKLLYHLTSVKNLTGILSEGLKARAHLSGFDDVADPEIIDGRKALGLERLVPFHWFAGNPFDGRIQVDRPGETFVLISVRRILAEQRNWKVIPFHPLASQDIRLLDYQVGFESIDWSVMSERDYRDPNCKSVCMAECLSDATVPPKDFFKIFVPSDHVAHQVRQLMHAKGVWVNLGVNEHMFVQ